MRDLPQQEHADLGIVDDDNTEDLRRRFSSEEHRLQRNENAPGWCWNTAEGDSNHPTAK